MLCLKICLLSQDRLPQKWLRTRLRLRCPASRAYLFGSFRLRASGGRARRCRWHNRRISGNNVAVSCTNCVEASPCGRCIRHGLHRCHWSRFSLLEPVLLSLVVSMGAKATLVIFPIFKIEQWLQLTSACPQAKRNSSP